MTSRRDARPGRAPRRAPDRIAATFARCRAAGEAALVTYVMAGDPDLATSKAMAVACAEGGADLLEIGIPFSDPIADGPTIQHAAERALAAGTHDARRARRRGRTCARAPTCRSRSWAT